MRIGHGFDVHRLVPGRPLILGGVSVPWHLGLLGHSDADVLLHAICDAILGALALGDIGKHFRVNRMLAKEAVAARLNSDAGISYTEFSYMLLQSYDFYWLRRAIEEAAALDLPGGEWGGSLSGSASLAGSFEVALDDGRNRRRVVLAGALVGLVALLAMFASRMILSQTDTSLRISSVSCCGSAS